MNSALRAMWDCRSSSGRATVCASWRLDRPSATHPAAWPAQRRSLAPSASSAVRTCCISASAVAARPWDSARSRPSSVSTSARRHHQPGEPLVVGRDHVPGRLGAAGVADHVLVGVHVFVPELALGDVAQSRTSSACRAPPGARAGACAAPPCDTCRKNLRTAVPLRARWRSKARMSLEALLPDVLAVTSGSGSFWRCQDIRGGRAPPAPPRSASG